VRENGRELDFGRSAVGNIAVRSGGSLMTGRQRATLEIVIRGSTHMYPVDDIGALDDITHGLCLRSPGSSRHLAPKAVSLVIGPTGHLFSIHKREINISTQEPERSEVELELLSHNPSAPLAGIMDLTGHNTSLCGDCACHPRPRDPMSHSIYTRAPLCTAS
jgi:hypothetical protein